MNRRRLLGWAAVLPSRPLMRSRRHVAVLWLAIGAGIAAAAAGTYAAGGTESGVAQLFYLPILAAAAMCGPLAGAGVGTISAVVCGFIPVDVAIGHPQDPRSWLVRGTFFVVTGVFTGTLSSALGTHTARLGRLRREAVDAFERAIDTMHHYTAEHSASVAEHAVAIARLLQVDDATVARVRGAALLHDVGKLAVPATVLDKAGPLSPKEWETVHGHVEASLAIVGCIEEFRPYMDGIRHHHERYDGGGYPDGLRGDAIPLEARIIAVADAYDAMVSHRAYRAPLPPATALAILRSHAGSQFDPRVVEAFESVAVGVDSDPQTAVQPAAGIPSVEATRAIASIGGL